MPKKIVVFFWTTDRIYYDQWFSCKHTSKWEGSLSVLIFLAVKTWFWMYGWIWWDTQKSVWVNWNHDTSIYFHSFRNPDLRVGFYNLEPEFVRTKYEYTSCFTHTFTGGMPNNAVEMMWAIVVLLIQVYISALILGTLLNYLVRTFLIDVAFITS